MAVLGTQALTLADMKKRLAPDGSTDFIIEALLNANPIMDDVQWMEGNLVTGNRTTIRTSMPTPSIRQINRGVTRSKSTTKQVQDTCIILEDRSAVDIELIALQNDKEGFRRSEDAAFVGGFTDAVAQNIFYGDAAASQDTFNGLSVRYNTLTGTKGEAGYQVVAGGTANASGKNTSGYFVGWGTHATKGIYPKNTKAGLSMRDLGEQTIMDDNKGEYQALVTLFNWKAGLAVSNVRANALVRNIDVTTLDGISSTAAKNLVAQFIKAKNRIQNLDAKDKKVILYVSHALYDFFEIFYSDKANSYITRKELMEGAPRLYLAGIEIKKCDAISDEEPAIE